MKTSALIFSLLLLASCSKVNKVDKRTQNLNNSESLLPVNDDLNRSISDLQNTTCALYAQIRNGQSEEARSLKFEDILKKGLNAERFGTKTNNAVIYFKSFEFQVWNSAGCEALDNRDQLLANAAHEFSHRMNDLYDLIDVKKLNPTADIERNNDAFSFYALAATMHATTQNESFYDILKNALKDDLQGNTLLPYQSVLVQGINKEIYIELIKARVDILAALSLKMLTDRREMTLGQTLKAVIFRITGGRLGSIDLPEVYADSNASTKAQVIELLKDAAEAKSFLSTINVKKTLEKSLKSAYQHIDLDSPTDDVEKDNIRGLIAEILN